MNNAFPGHDDYGNQQSGLNKLEYFMAHAPETIPDWFEHQEKLAPRWSDPEVPDELKSAVDSWAKDREYKLVNLTDPDFASEGALISPDYLPELERIQNHYEGYDWQRAMHRRNEKISRYFKWRAFYARELLNMLGED